MNICDVNHAVQAHKRRRRVGRGEASGWGKTAGRGHKGHGQKSGKSLMRLEGGQMQVFRRLPKRGFNNVNFRVAYMPVNLDELDRIFNDGEEVTLESLKAKGVHNKLDAVKVLGRGEISKKLTVKVNAISATAKEKIEKVGGTVEIVPLRKSVKDAAEA